jgi:alpha/beta superfamily hydrolase
MEETRLIPGPAGQLECRIDTPDGWNKTDPVAIVCHPHPLYGGSLTNKVVHMISKTFNELGCLTVRFNFRGVGKSDGDFANMTGEREDLLAVHQWLKQSYPDAPLWLAGFSFGAGVAILAHAAIHPQRLLVVAPAVDMYPALQEQQVIIDDWILAQGESDEVVSASAVMEWQNQQAIKPTFLWFEDTGHFFHGKLTMLNERIKSAWS